MRTRRSPRNQERLWRALGGPPTAKPTRTKLPSLAEARAKLFPTGDPMDPSALLRDLLDELRELEKFPDNRDLRLHGCSLLDALSRWLRMNGFPPIQDVVCQKRSS